MLRCKPTKRTAGGKEFHGEASQKLRKNTSMNPYRMKLAIDYCRIPSRFLSPLLPGYPANSLFHLDPLLYFRHCLSEFHASRALTFHGHTGIANGVSSTLSHSFLWCQIGACCHTGVQLPLYFYCLQKGPSAALFVRDTAVFNP